MRARELIWMHDRIPHEALPVKEIIPRQFFRLCCNQVSVWFASRSTPNRLGIRPSKETLVSHYDKWAGLEDPTYAYRALQTILKAKHQDPQAQAEDGK